jgi:hypothetical protein
LFFVWVILCRHRLYNGPITNQCSPTECLWVRVSNPQNRRPWTSLVYHSVQEEDGSLITRLWTPSLLLMSRIKQSIFSDNRDSLSQCGDSVTDGTSKELRFDSRQCTYIFFLFPQCRDWLWVSRIFQFSGYWELVDSPPNNCEVKNTLNYTSIPQYIFLA